MHFNLTHLILPLDDLSCLKQPFSTEEIKGVIQNLPSEKSPGPDGFNNEFIKKCLTIISNDFYNLISVFHQGAICLQSLNGSLITLVPKRM